MKTPYLKNILKNLSVSIALTAAACGSSDNGESRILKSSDFKSIKGANPATLTDAEMIALEQGFLIVLSSAGAIASVDKEKQGSVGFVKGVGTQAVQNIFKSSEPKLDRTEMIDQTIDANNENYHSYRVKGYAHGFYEKMDADRAKVSADSELDATSLYNHRNTVLNSNINGKGKIIGEVTSSNAFDLDLLTEMSGSIDLTTSSQHSKVVLNAFGIRAKWSKKTVEELKQASLDPLNKSGERIHEILNEVLGCKGSLVLQEKQVDCAEAIQAWIQKAYLSR